MWQTSFAGCAGIFVKFMLLELRFSVEILQKTLRGLPMLAMKCSANPQNPGCLTHSLDQCVGFPVFITFLIN